MQHLLMFAQSSVSGQGLVQALLYILLIGVCLCIVWFMGRYFATQFGAPPMFMKVWNALFLLLICIAFINFILGLIGHPFIRWY
jgi:hypothetical protein